MKQYLVLIAMLVINSFAQEEIHISKDNAVLFSDMEKPMLWWEDNAYNSFGYLYYILDQKGGCTVARQLDLDGVSDTTNIDSVIISKDSLRTSKLKCYIVQSYVENINKLGKGWYLYFRMVDSLGTDVLNQVTFRGDTIAFSGMPYNQKSYIKYKKGWAVTYSVASYPDASSPSGLSGTETWAREEYTGRVTWSSMELSDSIIRYRWVTKDIYAHSAEKGFPWGVTAEEGSEFHTKTCNIVCMYGSCEMRYNPTPYVGEDGDTTHSDSTWEYFNMRNGRLVWRGNSKDAGDTSISKVVTYPDEYQLTFVKRTGLNPFNVALAFGCSYINEMADKAVWMVGTIDGVEVEGPCTLVGKPDESTGMLRHRCSYKDNSGKKFGSLAEVHPGTLTSQESPYLLKEGKTSEGTFHRGIRIGL